MKTVKDHTGRRQIRVSRVEQAMLNIDVGVGVPGRFDPEAFQKSLREMKPAVISPANNRSAGSWIVEDSRELSSKL